MASIRKRGDKFEVRIIRRGQPAQCKSFATKMDAETWARRIERDIDRGIALGEVQASTKVTLSEVADQYRLTVTPTKRGCRQEATRLQALGASTLGKRALSAVKAIDVAKYRDERISRGAAPGTVRLDLAALSSVFTWAAQEAGYVGLSNPVRAVRKPAPGKSRDRRLRPGELAAVLAATDSLLLPALAHLAIATAARLGELLALTWKDVDLHKRVAVVRCGKNGDARALPLSTAALEVFRAMPQNIDGGPVFRGTSSHGVTVAWLRAVKRSRQRYESECLASNSKPNPEHLIGLHFHDLRHEGVSALFERGLNQIEVSSISGHKTLTMLRRYTHLRAEELALKLA